MALRARFLLLACPWWSACGQPSVERPPLEQLADAKACAECHPEHYQEWSGSMHAYAADDPVFRAMNARGQRETGGELGDFCVDCHAPMAVQLGLTEDGLNLDEVPEQYRGVTCYFCHQVDAVEGSHNNPLLLALDDVMRGGIADPARSEFHRAAYSPLLDRTTTESAGLCGSCHDIVNPKGTHIERTFDEWQSSLYAADGVFNLSCGECHMRGRDDVAAEAPGVSLRRVHDHSMAGVDVALGDWPEREAQSAQVQASLDTTVLAQLCVAAQDDGTLVNVILENVAAGHSWPSGASADRRAWVELVAYEPDGVTVGWSSGVVAADEAVTSLDDPNLWLFRDTLLDEAGAEVHMFWEAASFSSGTLPAPVTTDPLDPAYVDTHRSKIYVFGGFQPSRIALRVRIRPIGLDVLDDLIATGDLDPSVRTAMPTFDLEGTTLEWTTDVPVNSGDFACVPEPI